MKRIFKVGAALVFFIGAVGCCSFPFWMPQPKISWSYDGRELIITEETDTTDRVISGGRVPESRDIRFFVFLATKTSEYGYSEYLEEKKEQKWIRRSK